jgi:hypothetical protein
MKFLSLRRALVASLSFLALMAGGSAHAAFRAYLSAASGNDANACTLVAPCRLLPAALAAVDAGGEIWMLDSANFNTGVVGISKSVTILAVPGQLGSVAGINGTAFAISGVGIEVTLQNLNILSFSNTGDIGVLIGNAKQVSIIDCNIFGFRGLGGGAMNNGLGIWVNPGANAPKVSVVGSTIRNNSNGIIVAGNGRATISKTHVLDNGGAGIMSSSATGFSVVNVSDSVSSGNSYGFVADGCSGTTCASQMFVTRSVATENSVDGFRSQGGTTAFMVVGDSMSTHNGSMGFNNTVGTFQSRGNNTVSGNFNAQTNGTIAPQAGI